jgi:aryl-alcohol dehydrogenase-like predicted oxidoreductase
MRGASFVKLTLAAGVGATLAYIFDPVRGRRRRAELKDRSRASVRREVRAVERQASYGRGRAEGVMHKLRHPRPHIPEDDLTLADKIRSEVLGRVDGPHLTIDVNNRVVTLRGEVPDVQTAHHVEHEVRATPGVTGVVNLLHQPGTPAPNKADALRAEET